ncbi:hypothetical protein LEP1GSC170_1451 [Leptospira interrogans serovar Bataviae str. HAI135]|nr:hypothetical protein LEP1GSC170_1451 [Leptospira interrogans serovar Bataviae str. HAI135]
MFMCYKHWRMVPKNLQCTIWKYYRPGQCDDWKPSLEYCKTAKLAISRVRTIEGIFVTGDEPELKLYDLFMGRTGRLKVLSIRQPWAWLIIRPDITDPELRIRAFDNKEIKDIENRTRKTNFRGRFLIHASLKFDYEGLEFIQQNYGLCKEMKPESFIRGCIIGYSILSDCVTESKSRFFVGKYGYVLRDSMPISPFPYKGRLGFFNIDLSEGKL